MKIITTHPIYQAGKRLNPEQQSSLDGGSDQASISAFQKWYNKNKSGKLKVDGKWGPKTSTAFNDAGGEFETVMQGSSTSSKPKPEGGFSGGEPTKKTGKGTGGAAAKAKEFYGKAQESGVLDMAKQGVAGLFGKKQGAQGAPGAPGKDAPAPETPATDNKARNKKILIWTGVGLAVIAIAYVVSKAGSKKTA